MKPGKLLALPLGSWLGLLPLPATGMPLGPGALAQAARGAGIQVGAAVDTGSGSARLEIAGREFTSATLENALKWGPLAPTPDSYDFSAADPLVDWAEANGLRVRGHTLFWGRFNGPPGWLAGEVSAAADPAARLTELMESHAETAVGRYEGRIAQWDVVNEPLSFTGGDLDPDNPFFTTLGERYIDVAFAAASAADPSAALFLNETLTELLPDKFEGLMQLVQRLLDRGVPIDGVGLQGHFLSPPDRASLQSQLERIAVLGLLVELTEVDIPIGQFAVEPDPAAAQAEAYADVFAACVAVSACTGITTWGIDDSVTWLDSFFLTEQNAPNRPLLFDALGQPKPAYAAAVAELAAVPEPGTFGLTLLGLVLVGMRARGRTR